LDELSAPLAPEVFRLLRYRLGGRSKPVRIGLRAATRNSKDMGIASPGWHPAGRRFFGELSQDSRHAPGSASAPGGRGRSTLFPLPAQPARFTHLYVSANTSPTCLQVL